MTPAELQQELDRQMPEARRRFEDFHYRKPKEGEIANIGGLIVPTLGLEVGEFIGIGYKSVGNGVEYYHEFSGRNRPLVFVNSDGRQLYILKGGYQFTRRGFVG